MTREAVLIVFAIVFLIIIGGFFAAMSEQKQEAISSFKECAEAGNPILESYPRQCKTPDGRAFTEDVGDEFEKSDLIRVNIPRPNEIITSPLVVTGEARGFWFFEASFPLRLMTMMGEEVAVHYAEAQDDPKDDYVGVNWMTEEFVPFRGTLIFERPTTTDRGMLILEKDNPSGLPEHADMFAIPVRF